MRIILLSGGSGTRLWPLSNSVISKQFLSILPTDNGNYESMVQRIYRQVKNYTDQKVVIVAPECQRDIISLQLGDDVELVLEPTRKGTYNAIKLACSRIVKQVGPDKIKKTAKVNLDNAYIQQSYDSIINENGQNYYITLDEQVVVIPIDSFVEDEFFTTTLPAVENSIKNSGKMITLVGIRPTHPATQYGYIVPAEDNYSFFEKPSIEKATEYIALGGLWNAGIFGFSLNIFRYLDEAFIREHYSSQKDISFDCAMCEKTDSLSVVKYSGKWSDIGTWNSISEIIYNSFGNVTTKDCNNSTIVNYLNLPLVAIGLNNVVVAATNEGILVSDKIKSTDIKQLVKTSRPHFEKRRWGEYYVIDHGDGFLTKRMHINEGKDISYQLHNHRKEIWTIVSGEGILTINDVQRHVRAGDTVVIDVKEKHKIFATSDITIIETQLGDILEESDIERCSEESILKD